MSPSKFARRSTSPHRLHPFSSLDIEYLRLKSIIVQLLYSGTHRALAKLSTTVSDHRFIFKVSVGHHFLESCYVEYPLPQRTYLLSYVRQSKTYINLYPLRGALGFTPFPKLSSNPSAVTLIFFSAMHQR